MKKSELRSKRIYLRFLVTYFILVAAVVWPFYPLFNRTLSVVKDSMIKDSQKTLEIGFMDINNQILKFYDAAYMLSADSDFSILRRSTGNIETKDYYKLIRTQNYLVNMIFPSEIVLDIGVMFEKNEFIISKTAIYSDYTFMYPNFMQVEGKNFYQWKEILFDSPNLINIKTSMPVIYGKTNTNPGHPKETIPCVIPLPMTGAINKDCIMYFLLDSSLIVKHLISDEISKQGFLCIMDKNGRLILSHNYKGGVLQNKDKPVFETNLNGINTTLLNIENRDTGIKVVVGVPDSIFNKKIRPAVQFLFIYLLTAILLGIVMSLLFARRQSRPIQSIFNTVSNVMGRVGKKNEFEYIKDIFVEINQTNEAYRQQLDAIENAIKISLTQKILNEGPAGEQEKLDFMRYYNFNDTYFCVVVMDTLSPEKDVNREDMQRAHLSAAENIRKRIPHQKIIYSMDRGKMALILSLPEDEQSHLSCLGDIFRQISKEINAGIGFRICFRISAVVYGIENICQCYRQTKNILLYNEQDNTDSVYFYTKVSRTAIPVLFDTVTAQKLYDLILMGELEHVNQIFDKMNKHIIKYKVEGESDIRQVFYAIRNVLDAAARSLLMAEEDIPLPRESMIRELSMQDVLGILEGAVVKMCHYVEDKKRSKNIRLKQSILDYVAKNHNNPDLCISVIAEYFKLSEKYLFSLIREQTGKSFGEYLEGIRLKQAEKLLRETDIKINRIHEMIGFHSQNTFYKVFYRVYEISPGAWRSYNRPNDSSSILKEDRHTKYGIGLTGNNTTFSKISS